MKIIPVLLNTSLAIVLCSAAFIASAQTLVQCEKEIEETNLFLTKEGAAPVRDISGLATTLRTLTQKNTLPEKYISLNTAKNLGWSGNDTDTLWGIKPTNGKWIGGDSYANKQLPSTVSWRSADIDVERGYRGYKRLIYDAAGPQRYLTTDNFHHFVELSPCQ